MQQAVEFFVFLDYTWSMVLMSQTAQAPHIIGDTGSVSNHRYTIPKAPPSSFKRLSFTWQYIR